MNEDPSILGWIKSVSLKAGVAQITLTTVNMDWVRREVIPLLGEKITIELEPAATQVPLPDLDLFTDR